MTTPVHRAYYQALDADEAFEVALRTAYGSRACDKRYYPDSTYTPALRELSAAKKAADRRLLAEMEAARMRGE